MEKLKVFLSSAMTELHNERVAVQQALADRDIGVVWFEGFGARPQTAEAAYLEGVQDADVYVGIFWNQYSPATEEEYCEARRLGKPCFIYIKDFNVQREEPLTRLLTEIAERHVYSKFSNAIQLSTAVQRDLQYWIVTQWHSMRRELITITEPVEKLMIEWAEVKERIRHLEGRIEQLSGSLSRETLFEQEVAELLALMGMRSLKLEYTVDGYRTDIYFEQETPYGEVVRTVVECKFSRNELRAGDVSRIVSTLEHLQHMGAIDKAIVVSSSGFTVDARRVALSSGVELLDIDQLRGRVSKERPSRRKMAEIVKGPPPRKYAFVLMPFDEVFDDIFYFGIRGAVEEVGFSCKRVDDIQFNGDILEEVVEQIRTADIIIAEMTGRNPNVFYEVGYTHAIGKEVVLVVQEVEDVPFDLRGKNHIVYGGKIKVLKDKLVERLEALRI